MKIKKLLSVTLALMFAFGCLPVCVTAAALTAPAELTVEEYVPDGEPSDSGYQRYKLVDENGNEVVRTSYVDTLARNRGTTSLPSKLDLRDTGRVSDTILNQGYTGCCWAYSGIGAIESNLISGGYGDENSYNFSESHLSYFALNTLCTDVNDPSYGEGETESSPFTVGGHWKDITTCIARGSGLEFESYAPMDAYNYSSMKFSESQRFISETFLEQTQVIDSTYDSTQGEYLTGNMENIKQFVNNFGAVMVAYCSNPGSSYYYTTSAGKAYYQPYNASQDHAVQIIGWDDSFAVNNFNPSYRPPSPGAWLCRNSWGSSFSSDGCFWLSYWDKSIQNVASFSVIPRDEYCRVDNTYQHDNTVADKIYSSILYSTAKYGNVFVADGAESLEAASFWTEQTNIDYTVQIYTDISNNYDDPTDGTLAATISGFAPYRGYHTAYLTNPIALERGERFSVVVTVSVHKNSSGICTSDWSAARLCFEGNESRFTANPGESFLYFNTWKDATNYLGTNCKNAKIKAHTSNIGTSAALAQKQVLTNELSNAVTLNPLCYSYEDAELIESATSEAIRVSAMSNAPEQTYRNAALRLRTVLADVTPLGTIRVTSRGYTSLYFDLAEAISSVMIYDGTVMLCADVEVSSAVFVYGNVTLITDGRRRTVTRGAGFADDMLRVNGGASLVLGGGSSGNLVMNGGGISVPGSIITNLGTLTMNPNVKLTANFTSAYGGAVYNGGTFNFLGGEITGNTGVWGGGIYNYGTVNMSGAAKCTSAADDIYLADGCNVTLTGSLTGTGTSATLTPVDYTTYRAVLDGALDGNIGRFALADANYRIDGHGRICKSTSLDTSADSSAFAVYTDTSPDAPRCLVGMPRSSSVGDALALLLDQTGVSFYSSTGAPIAESQRLGTGDRIVKGDDELTVIIFGDINGDGFVDSLDVSTISRAASGLAGLDGVYAVASDVNGDGIVDSLDLSAVSRAASMLAEIDSEAAADAYYERMRLASQNSAKGVSPVSLVSEDASVVSGASADADSGETSGQSLLERIISIIVKIFMYIYLNIISLK